MKSLPKKISVAVSLLSVSLVVSFSSVGLNKSTGFLSEAKQFVKRADDTSAITFDENLGILKGLQPSTDYYLIKKSGASTPLLPDSHVKETSNISGEISLFDTQGEEYLPSEVEVEERAKLYGEIFIGYTFALQEPLTIVSFSTDYKFPKKADCIYNILYNDPLSGQSRLTEAQVRVKEQTRGNELTEDQKKYFTEATNVFKELYDESKLEDPDDRTTWTTSPNKVLTQIDSAVETYINKAAFSSHKVKVLHDLLALNEGVNDGEISKSIQENTLKINAMTPDGTTPSTIADIDALYKITEDIATVRKAIVQKKKDLNLYMSLNVYSRSKPLQLVDKAEEIRSKYEEKIEKSTTVQDADSLYQDFTKEINDLILSASWGKYCYIHWIYIVFLALYLCFFLIRFVFLKYRKLDLLNCLAIGIFAALSVAFTFFVACDLCIVMVIVGFSVLLLTLGLSGIYTIFGLKDSVYKVVTDEDVMIAMANGTFVSSKEKTENMKANLLKSEDNNKTKKGKKEKKTKK